MNNFKLALKQAIARQAMKIHFEVGKPPLLVLSDGQSEAIAGLVDTEENALSSYYKVLFKKDFDKIVSGNIAKGTLSVVNFGEMLLIAEPQRKVLSIFVPPRGEALFQKVWNDLISAKSSELSQAVPPSPSPSSAPLPMAGVPNTSLEKASDVAGIPLVESSIPSGSALPGGSNHQAASPVGHPVAEPSLSMAPQSSGQNSTGPSGGIESASLSDSAPPISGILPLDQADEPSIAMPAENNGSQSPVLGGGASQGLGDSSNFSPLGSLANAIPMPAMPPAGGNEPPASSAAFESVEERAKVASSSFSFGRTIQVMDVTAASCVRGSDDSRGHQ